jgi:hypothetical protein
MSVLEPEPQEVFSIRVFKVYEGYRWANTYEIKATDSVSYQTLRQAAQVIALREKVPLMAPARIYKATISTYVPDSRPYNPDTFTTVNLDLSGDAGFTVNTLPLNTCVFVRKNTLTGRPGKVFYRGFLSETDVSWGGDRFTISPQRVTQIEQVLNAMLADLLAIGFKMVLARGRVFPENVRDVLGMVVTNRASSKKLDNRYFDMKTR